MYHLWYNIPVKGKLSLPANQNAEKEGKRVPALFFCTEAGGEPVREWLRSLSPEDRKRIGEDIKSVEYGWPVGMPQLQAFRKRHPRGANDCHSGQNCPSAFLHRQERPDGSAPRFHEEDQENAG